jgi:hypothetical protein
VATLPRCCVAVEELYAKLSHGFLKGGAKIAQAQNVAIETTGRFDPAILWPKEVGDLPIRRRIGLYIRRDRWPQLYPVNDEFIEQTKSNNENIKISHRRVQFAPLSLQAQAERVEKIIPHTLIVPDSTHRIERRATQVNEMIAGKVKSKSTTTIEPWKEASPKILQIWKDRHPASHLLLFLADFNPSDRFEAFETICFKRNLAPTTAETYWLHGSEFRRLSSNLPTQIIESRRF